MIRDISIRAALNGFTVQCGCQQLVFESVDKLIDNLRDYLRDPDKHEKKFLSEAINRKHTHSMDPVCQPPPGFGMPVGTYITGTDPAYVTRGVYTTGTLHPGEPVCQTTCGTLPTEPCP